MSSENAKNIDNFKEIYEHVNNDYPLGVYFVKPDEYFLNNVPWHWHDEIEIDVVREGNAIYTIGEDIVRVPSNNLIIIKGDVVHSIKSENGNCSIISVIFSPAVLFSDSSSSLYQSYFKPFKSSSKKYRVFNNSDMIGKALISYIEDIIDYNLNKSYGYEMLTKSSLFQFWLLLIKDLPHDERIIDREYHQEKSSPDDERIKAAITFIQDNYFDNITLEEISESIHISKSECCRLFKRTINLSPFEYLMRYRILKACDIMIKSRQDESISELALNVGFNSASYFNKLFKKYVGCTPSEFKKKSKAERRDKLSPFGMSFSHI